MLHKVQKKFPQKLNLGKLFSVEKKQGNYSEEISTKRQKIKQIKTSITSNKALNSFLFIFMPSAIACMGIYLTEQFVSKGNIDVPLLSNSNLFVYLASILLSYPAGYLGLFLFRFISNISFIKWTKNISLLEELIAKFFELIFFLVPFTGIFSWGFTKFKETVPKCENEAYFLDTIFSMMFPIEFVNSGQYKGWLLGTEDSFIILVVRIMTMIVLTIIAIQVLRLLERNYRENVYDKNASYLLFPPELFRAFGYLIVFIVSSGLMYSTIVAELKTENQMIFTGEIKDFSGNLKLKYSDNNTGKKTDVIIKVGGKTPIEDNNGNIQGEILFREDKTYILFLKEINKDLPKLTYQSNNKTIHKDLYQLIISDKQSSNYSTVRNSKSAFGFLDFLPYSIFITMVGAVFAIATRDLLENYFAGIAQHVDAPFEEGDMITIDDSKIMKVDNIGFRNISLYDVGQNAIRFVPYKQLETSKIINYTEPDLNYRRSLHVNVSSKNTVKKLYNGLEGRRVTRRAEMLLLSGAFYIEGVVLPTLKTSHVSETSHKGHLLTQEREVLKALSLEKVNKLSSITSAKKIGPDLRSKVDELAKDLKKMDDLRRSLGHKKYESYKNDFIKNKKIMIKNNNSGDFFYGHKFEEDLVKFSVYAVKISDTYHKIGLLLWKLKEEGSISQNEMRWIDDAMLDLQNVPRVRSAHILDDENNSRWDIELAVTLKLAEQSDEIIHQINNHIDRYYQVFIGSYGTQDKKLLSKIRRGIFKVYAMIKLLIVNRNGVTS